MPPQQQRCLHSCTEALGPAPAGPQQQHTAHHSLATACANRQSSVTASTAHTGSGVQPQMACGKPQLHPTLAALSPDAGHARMAALLLLLLQQLSCRPQQRVHPELQRQARVLLLHQARVLLWAERESSARCPRPQHACQQQRSGGARQDGCMAGDEDVQAACQPARQKRKHVPV